MKKKAYKKELLQLQIELVKAQKQIIDQGCKLLVIVEGRDAAGKDSTIKRVVQHLSPRETRIVALGKPSDREQSTWYFQRYVPHLPAAGEFVLFNRSWYNRAGVERVMGFCDDDQYREFMDTVVEFESMLVRSGIRLFKFYLDIDKHVQEQRLAERRSDPLKQWKRSPIDDRAQALWDEYSDARNTMLSCTDHPAAPWTIVRANNQRKARLELIKHLLLELPYPDRRSALLQPDPDVLFHFAATLIDSGRIAA